MNKEDRRKVFNEMKEIIYSKHTPMDFLVKALDRMNFLWNSAEEDNQKFSDEEIAIVLNYIALFMVECSGLDKKNFETSIKGLKHYGHFFLKFMNALKECEDEDCVECKKEDK